MASCYFTLLVILSIVSASLQDLSDNEVDTEEINPFAEAAAAILKEQTAQNIGSMVNNFLQSGGAAKLGDAILKVGSEHGGEILQGLGSLMASGKQEEEQGEESNDVNVLDTLGTLVSAFQSTGSGKKAGKGDGTGALLQGLGSLLGGQTGQGGLNPALIGSLLNAFTSQNEKKPARQKKSSAKKKVEKIKSAEEPSFDASSLLSLAGTFLGQNQGDGEGGNFMSLLPMIIQTVGAFSGPDAERRAESHSGHSWLMPPVLEKLHIMFDNFIHSDMGKYFINSIGAEKTFKVFTDENGRFDYKKFGEMMENHSFRRHWIRMVTDRVVDMLHYASDPKAQKTYLINAQYFVNSFLKAQGFPKSALLDPTRPTETISAFVNYVAKKYFDIKISSKDYVQPAVEYTKELLTLAPKTGPVGSDSKSRELSDKIADTLNLEIIEPIARVNRAYRFAKSVPACDRYVLCLINEENQNEKESLPVLKKLLYKGSSLVAGWFLSSETGTSFWTLYSDVTDGVNCKSLYSEKCHDFHLEEIKVTTEYVHNEL